MSTSVTEHLQCSQVAVSHIIGKGGLTIKKLTSDTNTVITIIDGKTPNPSVRIVGDVADVSKAAKLVQAIIDNQTAPDYCGPQGSVLRAEADAAGEARSRLMTEASALFKSDQKSEGHSKMALAKEQGEIMVAKHQQAANAILQYNNSSSGPDKLDLHGLRVAEAVEFTNQRLDALELLEEDTDLLLCPGAGHHSATGVRALRHACEELLRKRGLTYETQDAGTYVVKVKGKGIKKSKLFGCIIA